MAFDEYRTCNRNRKLASIRKLGFHTDTVECGDLFFNLLTIIERINVVIPRFKIAVDILAKPGVFLDRLALRFRIQPCSVLTKALYHLVVDEPVPKRNLRRGVFSNAAADLVRLHEHTIHARVF